MTGNEAIAIVHGMVQGKAISGLTPEMIVRQAIEETWALDIRPYMREGGFFVTVAGQLTYSFAEIFGATDARVRTCRGIYDMTRSDDAAAGLSQNRIESRVYAALDLAIVNNLERTVTFAEDPGDTTEVWKADYYLRPPVWSPTAQLPVLLGWEYNLIIYGAMSIYELLKHGKPGDMRATVLSFRAQYPAALEADSNKKTYSKNQGVDLGGRVKLR